MTPGQECVTSEWVTLENSGSGCWNQLTSILLSAPDINLINLLSPSWLGGWYGPSLNILEGLWVLMEIPSES